MFTIFKDPKFNFQAPRRLILGLSVLMCLAGLYAIFLLVTGKANLGTDFGGGVQLHISAKTEVSMDALRETLDKADFKEVRVQSVKEKGATGTKLVARLRNELKEGVGTVGTQVVEALQKTYPEAGFALEGSDEVGPAVSAKLRDNAIKAFFLSMIVILVYIAFRFDFRYGVVSVIATVHDVLLMFAFIILTGMEFNLLSIVAILTISGYSLNDTVVIFDRIRENLKLVAKMSFLDLVNLSINETMNRTINTGGTTIAALIPVYLIGGESLHDFSLTILVGIVVGTYSSIFVAAALLSEWHLMTAPRPKA